MNDYPMIADHGVVGDLQTAALVSSDGTVDWWCTPRFDSPSVFASLLDSERGGHCRLAADFQGPGTDLPLQATPPIVLQQDGQDVRAHFTLEAGQIAAIVLTSDASGRRPEPSDSIEKLSGTLDACMDFWHAWLRQSRYRG